MYDADGKQVASNGYNPQWHTINNGLLKGREFYVDVKDGYWQKEIIEGTYDDFLFKILNEYDLNGKVIFEIGAHIGYHAMCFAQLVGETGKVYAFEPNRFNRERMKLILSKNRDLAERIVLLDKAVSNFDGETEFNFSSSIDGGYSSGSFIKGSHTPYTPAAYEEIGFGKEQVKVVSLNQVHAQFQIKEFPSVIKIDVEGAEGFVLQGAEQILFVHHPLILVEVHSTGNMFAVYDVLSSLGYKVELVKEEKDGRCFVSAVKRP